MAKKLSLSALRSTDLGTLSRAQLRQAYTTYRDVMQKRIARLSTGTAAQQAYAKPFQAGGSKELLTLGQIDKFRRAGWSEDQLRREMEMRVKELQLLEKSERLSISGWQAIEKRTVQSLQEHGYKNINKKNLKAFGNFMEKMRSAFGNKIFPSEEVAELFDAAGGELSNMDEAEILGILDDLGADITGVDLFA